MTRKGSRRTAKMLVGLPVATPKDDRQRRMAEALQDVHAEIQECRKT